MDALTPLARRRWEWLGLHVKRALELFRGREWESVGDDSAWVSHVSTHVVSSSTHCLCFEPPFLQTSKQPRKPEIVSPSGAKGRSAYSPL